MSTNASAASSLRRIAILLSLVDNDAGQQLLSQLPPATAQQVMRVTKELGPVTEEEQQQILTDFRRSTGVHLSAIPGRDRTTRVSDDLRQADPSIGQPQVSDPARSQLTGSPLEATRTIRSPLGSASAGEPTAANSTSAWSKLPQDVVFRFLVGERPNVIAVVVSQLDSIQAASMLQRLGSDVSCSVLKCLSTLGDIAPEAKAAIEEYLSESLGRQQQHIESNLENQRRIEALLAAAPCELRVKWREALGLDASSPDAEKPQSQEFAGLAASESTTGDRSAEHDGHFESATWTESPQIQRPSSGSSDWEAGPSADLGPDSKEGRGGSVSPVNPEVAAPEVTAPDTPHLLTANTVSQNQRTALEATQGPSRPIGHNALLPSISLEFEQLLKLPPTLLARALSTAGTKVVLLSLAGAGPTFLKRFCSLLHPRDARALKQRLRRLPTPSTEAVGWAQQELIRITNSILHLTSTNDPVEQRAA